MFHHACQTSALRFGPMQSTAVVMGRGSVSVVLSLDRYATVTLYNSALLLENVVHITSVFGEIDFSHFSLNCRGNMLYTTI